MKTLLSYGKGYSSDLAEVYGVTRQGVKKYLNKNGIDTSKRLWDTVCDYCGQEIKKPRCQIRNAAKHYCDVQCYRF